jgi:hypothetical protein
LSSTHSTANCNIKKECDRILASKRSESGDASNSSSSVTGQLRHLTDESFEDAVESEPRDEIEPCNDTNESDLLYFARVSNHYLRLVKPDPVKTEVVRHSMQYPIIVDSGANFHMFRDHIFFTHINPAIGKVILGNGAKQVFLYKVLEQWHVLLGIIN